MMERKAIQKSNQDQILEQAFESKRPVQIFLKNGVPLRGQVIDHDTYTILLETEQSQTLVYKHSVTSLLAARHSGPGPAGGASKRR